jgi:hypothetical protein
MVINIVSTRKNKFKVYVDDIEVHTSFSKKILYYIRQIGRKILTKLFYEINRKEIDTIFEQINIKQDDDILDIGFEDSFYYPSRKLFRQNRNLSYSSCSVKILKNGKLRFILPGGNRSAFENNRFTKIYTINTMFFINEYDIFFQDIKRILKQNGIFINVIGINKYLDKIFYEKHGYKELSIEEIKGITKKHMRIKNIIEIRRNKSYCIISEN